MSQKKSKKTGLTVSIVIAALLILAVICVIKSGDILQNLKETSFFEKVFGTTPSFIKNVPDKENTEEKDNGTLPAESAPADTVTVSPAQPDTTVQPAEPESTDKNAAGTEQKPAETVQPDSEKKNPVPAKKQVVIPSVMNVKLWFVQIDSDGSVSRREVSRQLSKNSSPLASAIDSLLAGPQLAEKNKGCMTLIPAGTKLLNASVKNGVALLSFSEEFEYNTYGVEGYLGQLQQIVYTATAFSTVNSVQFLLDGQKKDYLGSEGVWIGSPLARSSFR